MDPRRRALPQAGLADPDKIGSLDGKLLARVQVTPEAKYGKIIPVDDK